MKGKLMLGVIVLVFALAVVPLSCSQTVGIEDLTLSNYPQLFGEDAMIIVGENTSQIELESAREIAARLEELTGNVPVLKNDTALAEDNKANYNLIIIGTPESNEVLEQVYSLTNATRVTQEYPGQYKGILEVLRNPWNENKTLLMVTGTDEWEVKAAAIMLTSKDRIEELKGKTMVELECRASNSSAETETVPSGNLVLLVSPGNISANVGERIEFHCSISSLINTPVNIISVELDFFDFHGSMLRKQPMEKTSYWSAMERYTIVGDEASYRLLVNYTTGAIPPDVPPAERLLEYTADAFYITISE